MRWTGDTDRGAWLAPRVGNWATIGGVSARGFAAYARVLQPILAERGDEERAFRWADVAHANDVPMHPLVTSETLTAGGTRRALPDGWEVPLGSQEGWFDPALLAAMVPHLAAATTAPDVTVGIWNGWGQLHPESTGYMVAVRDDDDSDRDADGADADGRGGGSLDAELARLRAAESDRVDPDIRRAAEQGPTLELPGREFVLLTGALDELADPGWGHAARIGWSDWVSWPCPQLVWPADEAWLVASEIDWDSTIVAGPRALVDAVLADDRFEAFEVAEDDALAWG